MCVTRSLPSPFMVLATQNPIEYEGTFPLPEAQLDRFLLRLPVGYPTGNDEKAILKKLRREHPINHLNQVVEIDAIQEIFPAIWDVFVEESLEDYIVRLVGAGHPHPPVDRPARSRIARPECAGDYAGHPQQRSARDWRAGIKR